MEYYSESRASWLSAKVISTLGGKYVGLDIKSHANRDQVRRVPGVSLRKGHCLAGKVRSRAIGGA